MMSSWLSVPRWVWKVAPARKVIRWPRPFGSVSRTGSPAVSGPWRGFIVGWPSDAGERVVDVAPGQDAEDLAGGLHEQVLGGSWGAADGLEQRHARQVGGQHQVRLERPGQRARLDPRPPLRRGR